MAGLEIMHYKGCPLYNQNLEVETGVTLVIEDITDTTHEAVRYIGIIIMTIGETTIEVKVMTEIGVDH